MFRPDIRASSKYPPLRKRDFRSSPDKSALKKIKRKIFRYPLTWAGDCGIFIPVFEKNCLSAIFLGEKHLKKNAFFCFYRGKTGEWRSL